MLLNAPNATLQTLRSGWSTNITNAAIATQVDQLVAFIMMYEFLLYEGEFVYAVTAAEGIILSLFTSNEQ